ncbi:hypothetical protein, partial [Burkholderia cenocepacia]|uniref:hypothetical protein n=1 Tax=Burkholderia cenocepacia TaxID=95486 RepID=UPI002855F191
MNRPLNRILNTFMLTRVSIELARNPGGINQLRDRVTKARKQNGQERQNGAAGGGAVSGGKTCSQTARLTRAAGAPIARARQNFARMPAPNVLPVDRPLMWSFM